MVVKTTLCGVEFKNPLILASGILDTTASSLVYAIENGAGGVTCKSISLEPRTGHKAPIIATRDDQMLNAVGLSNPGIESSIEEIKDYKKRCKAPIIGNIFASSIEDFCELAKKIEASNCDLLELNLSCPNVKDEFGTPFACNKEMAAKLTSEVKKATKIPIFIKLAPNVPSIAEIARAVEKAGADGITAINTMPGMMIDINTAKPMLTNKVGGYSGPNLKPIAMKCVHDIYKTVKIPIIGTGGITTGPDAIEMLMAGASAIGIGSAIYYRGIDVFKKITDEMKQWMKLNNYTNIQELIGEAHHK